MTDRTLHDRKPQPQPGTTGHEWDGIRELNTPLPRWWLWLFYATIVWAIGYWIVYPAWPLFASYTNGVFDWHARSAVGLAALWIGFKYWQRRRFMKSLRVARITPEEVLARLDQVVILDLRTPTEVEWDGMKVMRARWFDRKELELRHQEIPRDRDVVLYCT